MSTRRASHRNPIAFLPLLCLLALGSALHLPYSPAAVVSAKSAPPAAGASPAGPEHPGEHEQHPTPSRLDYHGPEGGVGEGPSDCKPNDLPFIESPLALGLALPAFRPRLEHANGWIYPAGIAYPFCGYCTWRCQNPTFNNQYHLAQDMCNPQGDPVYAVDYGEVIHSQCVGSYGGPSGGSCGGAVAIQHRAKDGTWFTALYGHLDDYLPAGTRVYAGDVVGYSNNWN